jgi:hypothetical protein
VAAGFALYTSKEPIEGDVMLALLWNLSAAFRSYLRVYMPSNRAVDWLRTPRGLKWAIPAALVATPAYLGLTTIVIQLAACPGRGWFNVLVLLFFWNAAKFAWMAVLAPVMWLSGRRDHAGGRGML